MKKIDLKKYDDAYLPGKEQMLLAKINELVEVVEKLHYRIKLLEVLRNVKSEDI